MRRGQAMIETVLAVLFITFVFFGLFQLSQMLTARILLDHAAARAARAKAVGFNAFMCRKAARVATIPIAGRRLWPDDLEGASEVSRVPIYLSTRNEQIARGVLQYERWETLGLDVRSSHGLVPEAEADVSIELPRFWSWGWKRDDSPISMSGSAALESHFPLYMDDGGL